MTDQASPSKFVEAVLTVFVDVIGALLTDFILALIVWAIFEHLIRYSVTLSAIYGFCLLLKIGVKAVKTAWKD